MKNIDFTSELQRLEEENAFLKTINEFIDECNSSTLETNTRPILDLQLHKKTKPLRQEKDDAIYDDADKYEKQSEKLQEQAALESEIGRLTQEIQHAKEENHNLMKQTQVLQKKNTELTTNIRLLQKKNDDTCEENENLKTINQLLQDDNKSVQDMRNEIQQLRLENNNMNREIQKVQEENNNMHSDMRELQQENNELKEIQQTEENAMDSLITESGSVVVSREELGRGAFAAVYTGDYYGTKVAVKEFHEVILSPHNEEILKREIYITSQCRHPNLLQFICATRSDRHCLLIVTELMDMALRTLLEQHARERLQFEYQKVKSISLDVARGLNYLHSKTSNPIIHRDVSSANVLLWIENGAVRRAKVSDYGSANFMEACNTANPGAALYAAPEASRGQQGPKIDVFSYGVLVCEMSICQLPHPEQVKRKGQMRRILNAGIKGLVEGCTEIDPQKRPTMQDVIEIWQNKIRVN
ncbi:probable serine threonine- kinase DDB_G0271682 [Paramuricea clavata]|uniref:Probable serine threonine- kinase DDB_G0271682 n=1 Tax=Paramuricea clavata TaxID=317549 RepID=A0A7D9IKI3_PARCT|nr:probable serine threonine- kinase DDB_G0271682 [Paramuricea clavata]